MQIKSITIMKKITTLLVAALFCGSLSTFAQDDEISVTPAFNDDFETTFKFNKDYAYYCIYLDDETRAANIDDDHYVYLGPDSDNGRNLWIWDGQSTFGSNLTGNNSFDVPGAYMSYIVGGAGWSGIGYNIAAGYQVDLSGINDDYKFHIALKSTGSDSFDFYLTDGSGHEAHLVFGSKAFDTKEPVADFNRDGEWYNIDIPMTYLEDNFGLSFKKDNVYTDKNILCLLAGGNSGFTIDYDAVFFYGPKGTNGINDVNADKVAGTATEYYTIDGKKMSADAAKNGKGVYIVKKNGVAKKVVND